MNRRLAEIQTRRRTLMTKKSLIIMLILVAFTATGSLYAYSTFGIASVNYGRYSDMIDGDSEEYLPGIRAEFFFSEYLGVSADAIITYSSYHGNYQEMVYIFDVVLRIPLGFTEPYIATGPAYSGVMIGDYTETGEEAFAYNVRGGVDFNILDWLSVGIETNFLVENVQQFISELADSSLEDVANMIKTRSLIGATVKVKF